MKYMSNDYGHFIDISEDANQPNTIIEPPKPKETIKKTISRNNIYIRLFNNKVIIECNKYFLIYIIMFSTIILWNIYFYN